MHLLVRLSQEGLGIPSIGAELLRVGDVRRGLLNRAVQLGAQRLLGRIPPVADARPRFREVLGFDLSPCLGEPVQQGSRVDVHLPTGRNERLSLREFLLEAGPEDSETPIKTARESRSRASDLAGFKGCLPFLEEFLELGCVRADLVRRLEEFLRTVSDLLRLFEQNPEVRDRIRCADRRVERPHKVGFVKHLAGVRDEPGYFRRPVPH